MDQKFLLCENPMRNKGYDFYIYSGRPKKRGLIKVNKLDDVSYLRSFDDSLYNNFTVYFIPEYGDLSEPEFYELSLHDSFDIPDEKIHKLMEDAGIWFKDFLKWEEKEYVRMVDEDPNSASAEKSLIQDYNDQVKGLKIFHYRRSQKWLVLFKSKANTFASKTRLFTWLFEELNIPQDLLEDGFINKI